MGRVTYGRVTEGIDLPRPFYDENMQNGDFEDMTKEADKAAAAANEKPSL